MVTRLAAVVVVQNCAERINILNPQSPAGRGENMADNDIAVRIENVGLNGRTSSAERGKDGDVARVVVVTVTSNWLYLIERVEWPGAERRTSSFVGALRVDRTTRVQLVDSILLRGCFVSKRMVRDTIATDLPSTSFGVVVVCSGAFAAVSTESEQVVFAVFAYRDPD